jgi:hypothetical protein
MAPGAGEIPDPPIGLQRQAVCGELREGGSTRKGEGVCLRALCLPESGKLGLTPETRATAVGDADRRKIQQAVGEFGRGGEEFQAFLSRPHPRRERRFGLIDGPGGRGSDAGCREWARGLHAVQSALRRAEASPLGWFAGPGRGA